MACILKKVEDLERKRAENMKIINFFFASLPICNHTAADHRSIRRNELFLMKIAAPPWPRISYIWARVGLNSGLKSAKTRTRYGENPGPKPRVVNKSQVVPEMVHVSFESI